MNRFLKKYQIILLIPIILLVLVSFQYYSVENTIVGNIKINKEYRVNKIVIDAGHGGKDPGCKGTKVREKHIALKVALKLGKLIEDNFSDVEVIYTRKKDVFVPLHKRADIANKNNADLFISIHCNAIRKGSRIRGSETYVLGLHRAEDNLDVARRENKTILMEDDYDKHYDGFDPNSPEGHILLSMYQNAYMEQSILFAEMVEKKFKAQAKYKSRGVKQAGFVVLRETTMPSVLIETGYLTNSEDERFLSTEKGQTKMAIAIMDAFKNYKNTIEPSNNDPILVTDEPLMKQNTPLVHDNKPDKIVFRVQVAATPSPLAFHSNVYKIKEVEMCRENNLYKYLAGKFKDYEDASTLRNQLVKQGHKGVFVVAYNHKTRIPVQKAKKIVLLDD